MVVKLNLYSGHTSFTPNPEVAYKYMYPNHNNVTVMIVKIAKLVQVTIELGTSVNNKTQLNIY